MTLIQSSSFVLLLASVGALCATAAAQNLQGRLDNHEQNVVRKGLPEVFRRPLPVRQGVQATQTATPATSTAPQTVSQSVQTETLLTTQPTTTRSSQTSSVQPMTTASYQSTSSDTFNWGNGNAGTGTNAATQYSQYGTSYGNNQNYGSSSGYNQNYANSGGSQNYGINSGNNQNYGNSYGSSQGYGNGRRRVDFWTVMTENDLDDNSMYNSNF